MTKISGVVALLLLPLLAAGCSASDEPEAAASSPTASATTSAPDPDFEKPAVGECRLMSASDIPPSTNDTATVPCSEPHTAVTVAVLQLPGDLTFKRKGVLDFVGKACQPRADKATGLSGEELATTIFTTSWFIPTEAQRKAGARWLRCDVNAYTYNGRSIAEIYDLPRLPLAGDRIPEDLQSCYAGEHDLLTVSCVVEHTYRATEAFRVHSHGKKYPRTSYLDGLAEDSCRRLLGTDGPYAWNYPGTFEWELDRAWVSCYEYVGGGTAV